MTTPPSEVLDNLGKLGIMSWQSIMEFAGEPPGSIVEGLIEEGGISLLVARQKEGKSMLSAQLAIDVSLGEPFLDRLPSKKGTVLYIDYENRRHRLKARGVDLAGERRLDNVLFRAFDRIADRNVGLDGDNLKRLTAAVGMVKPALLVIDPLRLATSTDLLDAGKVVPVLERVSTLQQVNPDMGVLLVHHLKKGQGDLSVKLKADPREWIERAFGSQALLAHVETILGLEQDKEDRRYTLATVPRSSEPLVWALEKAPNSERFLLSSGSDQLATWPPALRNHWVRLPDEFSWSEGMAIVGNSTVDRIIRRAKPAGLLTQHALTKRYRKATALN
jgi:hypothetical protein